MRADPIFQALFAVVHTETRKGRERQALSHHTTASCRREGAPIQSLKASGIDTAIVSDRGVRVRLIMPNFMEASDGRRVEYETAICANHDEAKRLAAQEYLCLLLGVEPNMVWLPNKCFTDGCRSVGRLREAARVAHAARGQAAFDAWAWAVGTHQEAYTGPPPPPPAGQLGSRYTAPAAHEENARDQLILDTIQSWQMPMGGFRGCHMRREQYEFLEEHIPRRGLMSWLQRHSDVFRVWHVPGPGGGVCWDRVEGVSAATRLAAPAATAPAAAAPAAAAPADASGPPASHDAHEAASASASAAAAAASLQHPTDAHEAAAHEAAPRRIVGLMELATVA